MDMNPYESPKTMEPITPIPRTNIFRGLAYAVPLGILGFCIPALAIGFLKIIDLADSEWRDLPREITPASIACFLVFFCSALANYTPPKGFGLVRSLMFVGGMAVIDVFIVAIILPVTNYIDPYKWIRFVVFFSMTSISGLGYAIRRIWIRNPLQPTDPKHEQMKE
jgi:hypothetical protein